MRVVMESVVDPVLDQMAGVPPTMILKFSDAERKTLRRAAEIAEQARQLWRATVDYDVESCGMDTELGMIESCVDEIVSGIIL